MPGVQIYFIHYLCVQCVYTDLESITSYKKILMKGKVLNTIFSHFVLLRIFSLGFGQLLNSITVFIQSLSTTHQLVY